MPTCDLVTLRCVLDGHVKVPHLTDALEDRCSALFKDVDVGAAWRCRVIPEAQGPVYSVCKSELGLGRDVLIGDEVGIMGQTALGRLGRSRLGSGTHPTDIQHRTSDDGIP